MCLRVWVCGCVGVSGRYATDRRKNNQYKYLLFVQYFHGVVLLGRLVLDQHDAPKRSRAERLDPVEIIQTRRVLKEEKKSN